ncbi:hypothetical protein [Bradyrhizobium sp.]|uniref:hypothetical protein n=1 Tax=Bradyrhizobium sp. TaxID=376 RepID=UPI003C55333D
MAADPDRPGLAGAPDKAERRAARDAGTVWGLVLDHFVDKHLEAAAAMKINPDGGVARTPEGVVVTSKELVLQVLLNSEGNYTVEGYQPRMQESIGVIYLGMDWGPEYERQSTPANAAIGRVTRREAFDLALKETRAALTTVPAPNGIIDIQAVSDVVFAKLCSHWFDIPDGVYVKPGGFRISNLLPPGICPGDYTMPSGYIVHPDPDVLLTLLGQRTGQILRESVNKYVADKRAAGQLPTAALTRAFFEEFPKPEDNDLLARTIVGVMMGALPTINGNLVTIVKTWQRTATLLALQAKLNASTQPDEFVKAHDIVETPMRQTMQNQPTPDWLWRLATKDHTIGAKNPVQVHAGDKIYLSITQATQEELRAGGDDVCPLFGGDRSRSPHPTHACPGFEMGFGILLGIVYGVVDYQPTAAGP